MNKLLTAVFILLLHTNAFAVVSNGLTIPDNHPRLFWTAEKKSAAQTWATANSYTALTVNTRGLDPYDNLFGCYVLGDATSCATVISAATSFNSTCTTTSGCDDVRRSGEWVLLTYDWLYDQLTTEQRSAMISNWNTWMTNQNNVVWGGPTMPTSNYFSGRLRNDFTFGIATIGDNPSATNYLTYGMTTLWGAFTNYLSLSGTGTLGKTGYGLHNQEGGGEYGRYGLNYYGLMLPASKMLGRNLWEETTAFKSGVLQTIYNTMPQQTATRGLWDMFTWGDDEVWGAGANCGYQSHNGYDGHGGCGAGSQYYGDFMQSAANEWVSTSVGALARTWISTVNPAIGPIQRSVASGGAGQLFSTLPLDYYSSGAQYLYTRNNWSTNATSILWQMGSNRGGTGHGHRDAGTFQVHRKGVNIIRETPAYSETVAGYQGVGTVNAAIGHAHNIPFVGGLGSLNISGVNADGPGEVKRLQVATEFSFAATDLTKTYQNVVSDSGHPERQNPYVVSVVRELYYLRGVDVMLVVDRYKTDTPARSTAFISHCEANPTIASPLTVCSVGGQSAAYTALVPAAPTITATAENANSATADNWQYRIEAENTNPGNVVSYSIYAIELCDTGTCSKTPSVLDSNVGDPLSGTFTISIDASNSVIVNKGIASAGGEVIVSGVSTSLADAVAAMQITDDGPTWGPPAADTAKPATTPNKAAGRYQAKQEVELACTDNVGCTEVKYCLTPGCTPTLTYSAPIPVLKNIAYQVLRYSSIDATGNVETVKESVFRKQRRR